MSLTMTDLFAGAGGSSTGATQVDGVVTRLAANHWEKAVEVHNANHPGADHLCADISSYNPRHVAGTDLLWASPECTNHSQAKGIARYDAGQPDLFGETLPDEAAERSRATMWDVPRWTEAHRYEAIIVENVVEAAKWEPFQQWLGAMGSYGYEHEIVCMNSMHAQAAGLPAPQSRDRMYVVFWKKGNKKPDLSAMQRPLAWCPSCTQVVESVQSWKKPGNKVGRYRAQYVYRCGNHTCRGQIVEPAWLPASSAIDWDIVGTRIGDREKPLADKTRKRIAAGIARYWHPFTLEAAGNTYDAADPKHVSYDDPNAYYRAWSALDVLKTLHTTASRALAIPVEGREGKEPRSMEEAFRTLTTRAETAMAYDPAFMLERRFDYRTRGLEEPMSTLTANETTKALIQMMPFIAELRGGGSTARSVDDPMCTVTASGNHHGLVSPYYGNSQSARSTDDAIGTLTPTDRYGLVTPAGGSWNDDARPTEEALRALTTRDAYALVMRNNGGGAEMTTPAHEVMRTLTTAGHQSVLTPGDMKAAEAQVDDCMFRMLEPSEVAAGMAFPGDYQWLGTRREQVRMAGNAVTPPAARDLITCVAESLR